jgi:hypothetical protein
MDNEYSVSTNVGLYFMTIVKDINGNFEMTENKDEFYNKDRSSG